MSLRTRLVATVVGLLALGLAVASFATFVALRSFLLQRVDQELRYSGFYAIQDIARAVHDPTPNDTQEAPTFPPGAREVDAAPMFAQVRDEHGRVVKTYWNTKDRPRLPDPLPLKDARHQPGGVLFTAEDADGDGRFRVLILPLPDHSGYGVLATSLDGVYDTLRYGLIRTEVIVGSIVLIAVTVLASQVVRRGTRPLAEITEDARAIEGGNVERHVRHAGNRTEVGRLSSALNGAFTARRESEQRLRRFIADASHELRTPLTSIRGYAEMFRRGAGSDPEDLAIAMRRIEAEASRMGSLVDELLLLARLDQGRPLAQEPVDLADLVADAVADTRAVEPDRPVTFDKPETVPVTGDEARLRQAIANLLTNVREHTPSDAPVQVRLSCHDPEGDGSGASAAGYVRLEVIDSGPGLSAEQRERVFERFYRADPSRARSKGGSGLGLAIVAAIAAAHEGTAGVATPETGGSRFWLELPLDLRPGGGFTGISQP